MTKSTQGLDRGAERRHPFGQWREVLALFGLMTLAGLLHRLPDLLFDAAPARAGMTAAVVVILAVISFTVAPRFTVRQASKRRGDS